MRPAILKAPMNLKDKTRAIWLMNLDGSDLRQLTPTDLDFTVHEVSWGNWQSDASPTARCAVFLKPQFDL